MISEVLTLLFPLMTCDLLTVESYILFQCRPDLIYLLD